MSDVRPFEEYKEMIKDMGKEEMIRGLYDLSARVTKQENIIKEVREIFKDYGEKEDIVGYTMYNITGEMLIKLLEILDKEKV